MPVERVVGLQNCERYQLRQEHLLVLDGVSEARVRKMVEKLPEHISHDADVA